MIQAIALAIQRLETWTVKIIPKIDMEFTVTRDGCLFFRLGKLRVDSFAHRDEKRWFYPWGWFCCSWDSVFFLELN